MDPLPSHSRPYFYGISAGIIAGLLVHVIWRQSELADFEQRLRSAGVPSEWFESPKSRAALIDSNLFNFFRTGPTYDLLFWPLAGATIAYCCRPSSAKLSSLLIGWTIGVAAFGVFSIADTNSRFRKISDRELPRALQTVVEWEEREKQRASTAHEVRPPAP